MLRTHHNATDRATPTAGMPQPLCSASGPVRSAENDINVHAINLDLDSQDVNAHASLEFSLQLHPMLHPPGAHDTRQRGAAPHRSDRSPVCSRATGVLPPVPAAAPRRSPAAAPSTKHERNYLPRCVYKMIADFSCADVPCIGQIAHWLFTLYAIRPYSTAVIQRARGGPAPAPPVASSRARVTPNTPRQPSQRRERVRMYHSTAHDTSSTQTHSGQCTDVTCRLWRARGADAMLMERRTPTGRFGTRVSAERTQRSESRHGESLSCAVRHMTRVRE